MLQPSAQGAGAKHGGWRAGLQAGGRSITRKQDEHLTAICHQPARVTRCLGLSGGRGSFILPQLPLPPLLPEPPRWQGGHGGLLSSARVSDEHCRGKEPFLYPMKPMAKGQPHTTSTARSRAQTHSRQVAACLTF